jgi:hypothetical protein
MNQGLLRLFIVIFFFGFAGVALAETTDTGSAPHDTNSLETEDPGKRPFSVTQPDDLMLNCDQLWEEAFTMKHIIASTQDMRSDSEMRIRGIGVLGTAASYLVGTVTGGIGIAAAGMIAKEAASSSEESAEKIQDVAEQRRTLMVSLFNIRQCEGDIQQAMIDPVPVNPIEKITRVEPASGPEDASNASPSQQRQYNN